MCDPRVLQEYLGAQDQRSCPKPVSVSNRHKFHDASKTLVELSHLRRGMRRLQRLDVGTGVLRSRCWKAPIEGRRCNSTVKYDLCRWSAKTAVVLNYSMPPPPGIRIHATPFGLDYHPILVRDGALTGPLTQQLTGARAPVEISVGSGLSQSEAERVVESAHFSVCDSVG